MDCPVRVGIWSRQRKYLVNYLGSSLGDNKDLEFASKEVCEAVVDE